MENPKKRMINHGLSKRKSLLLCSGFILYGKKGYLLYNKDVLPQKKDLVFYLTSLSTFYSFLKRSTSVLALIVQLHVSLIV